MQKVYSRICVGCGIPFIAHRIDKVYHNANCKWKDWNSIRILREQEVIRSNRINQHITAASKVIDKANKVIDITNEHIHHTKSVLDGTIVQDGTNDGTHS